MFCIYFTITAQAAYPPISEHVSLLQIEREEADHQCVLTFSCEVRVPPAVQVKLHQESTYGQDINHDNTLQHTHVINTVTLLFSFQPCFTFTLRTLFFNF